MALTAAFWTFLARVREWWALPWSSRGADNVVDKHGRALHHYFKCSPTAPRGHEEGEVEDAVRLIRLEDLGIFGGYTRPGFDDDRAGTDGDVHEGRRTDSAALMCNLPSPR